MNTIIIKNPMEELTNTATQEGGFGLKDLKRVEQRLEKRWCVSTIDCLDQMIQEWQQTYSIRCRYVAADGIDGARPHTAANMEQALRNLRAAVASIIFV